MNYIMGLGMNMHQLQLELVITKYFMSHLLRYNIPKRCGIVLASQWKCLFFVKWISTIQKLAKSKQFAEKKKKFLKFFLDFSAIIYDTVVNFTLLYRIYQNKDNACKYISIANTHLLAIFYLYYRPRAQGNICIYCQSPPNTSITFLSPSCTTNFVLGE